MPLTYSRQDTSVSVDNASTKDAVQAAARWALSKGLLFPFEFRRCITGLQRAEERVVRVRYRGRHREVVVREAATTSRKRKLHDPIDPHSIDPWQDGVEDLPRQTQQLCACSACRGERKVLCPVCHGAVLVFCDNCNGSGSVFSPRTGNPINCPACKGVGQRRCNCRNGQTNCSVCNGKGKVERWLAIAETTFDEIRVDGSVTLRQLTGDDSGSYSFDNPPLHTVRLADGWSGSPSDALPAQLETVSATPALQIQPDPYRDRIEHVDVQVLSAPVTDIRYKVAFTESMIRVVGVQDEVFEPRDIPGRRALLRPLRLRLVFLGLGVFVAFLVGMMLAGSYIGRHDWYSKTSASTALVILALFLPLVTLPVLATIIIPRPRGQLGLIGGLSVAPLLMLAVMMVLRTTGDPSVGNARAAWRAGQRTLAKKELRAAIALGIDANKAKALHDQIILEELASLRSPAKLWSRSSKELYLKKNRESAAELVYSLTLAVASQKRKRADVKGTDKVLRQLPGHLQARPEVSAHRAWIALVRLKGCLKRKAVSCVFRHLAEARKYKASPAKTKKIFDQVRNEQSRLVAAALVTMAKRGAEQKDQALACEEAEKVEKYAQRLKLKLLVPGWDEKQKMACVKLKKRWKAKLAAQRKREEARRRREQRRAEVRRRREERRAEARRRREAYRERLRKRRECRRSGRGSAKCCDGSYSPSCGCGGGRGCCSHHRGVCGCSCDDL